MPAIPLMEFQNPAKIRRQIKGKQLKVSLLHNKIDRHIINNEISNFMKTVIEWNHLSTEQVCTETVKISKQAPRSKLSHHITNGGCNLSQKMCSRSRRS